MGTCDLMMLDDSNRPFTAYASAYVKEGWIVKATSSDDVVISGVGTFASTDILVAPCDDSLSHVGIAMNTAASGAAVTVLREGTFILPAGSGAVTSGYEVTCAGYGSGTTLGGMVEDSTIGTDSLLGKAYTGASAVDKYVVVGLNL